MMENKGLLPNANGFHRAGHINGTDVTMADVASATETLASLADRGIGPMQWVPKGAGGVVYADLTPAAGSTPLYGEDGLRGGGLYLRQIDAASEALTVEVDFKYAAKAVETRNTVILALRHIGAEALPLWVAASPRGHLVAHDNTANVGWPVPSHVNVFDGQWHNLAVVARRDGGQSAFLDGKKFLEQKAPAVFNFSTIDFHCMEEGWTARYVAADDNLTLKNVSVTTSAKYSADYTPQPVDAEAPGVAGFYPLINGLIANRRVQGWTELPIPEDAKGFRFYLKVTDSLVFTVQESGTPPAADVAFYPLSGEGVYNWDESLSGLSVYVRDVAGSPLWRIY